MQKWNNADVLLLGARLHWSSDKIWTITTSWHSR